MLCCLLVVCYVVFVAGLLQVKSCYIVFVADLLYVMLLACWCVLVLYYL